MENWSFPIYNTKAFSARRYGTNMLPAPSLAEHPLRSALMRAKEGGADCEYEVAAVPGSESVLFILYGKINKIPQNTNWESNN
jgi:hypothetical protein